MLKEIQLSTTRSRSMSPFLALALVIVPIAVGASVVYRPELLLAGLAALIVAALAILYPRSFVGLAAVVFLFVRTLAYRFDSETLGYLDELFVFVAVVILPMARMAGGDRLRGIPGLVPFSIFLAIGIGSGLVNDVPVGVLVSGLLLAGKGLAFGLAVAQIDWRADDLSRIAKFSCWVMGFVIGCAVVNLIAPGFWLNTVLDAPSFGPRFGLQPVLGPFVHPGYFGTCLALFALGLLAYRLHVRASLGNTVLLSASVFFAILTFRRKVIAALAVGAAYLIARSWGIVGLIAAVALAPLFIFLSWGYLSAIVSMTYTEYVVDYEQVARVRLYIDGIRLGFENFPLGEGFGRFGTGAARADYSPVYLDLGYPYVWGLGPNADDGKFLTDTFWPGVVGEAGLLGGVAYAAGLVAVFRSARRFSKLGGIDPTSRWIAVLVCAWTLELTIESFAGAVFTAAPTYGLFFGVLGVFAAVSANTTESKPVDRNCGEVPNDSAVFRE